MSATGFLDGNDPLFDNGTEVFDENGTIGFVMKTESVDGERFVTLMNVGGKSWITNERNCMKAVL